MRSHEEIYEHLLQREKEYQEKQAKKSENRKRRVAFFGVILAGIVLVWFLIAMIQGLGQSGQTKTESNPPTEYAQQTTVPEPSLTDEPDNPKKFDLYAEITADQKKGHASSGEVAPTETARITVTYSVFNEASGLVLDYVATGEGIGTVASVDVEANEYEAIIKMESEYTVYEGETCVYTERVLTIAQ